MHQSMCTSMSGVAGRGFFCEEMGEGDMRMDAGVNRGGLTEDVYWEAVGANRGRQEIAQYVLDQLLNESQRHDARVTVESTREGKRQVNLTVELARRIDQIVPDITASANRRKTNGWDIAD